MSNEEHAPSGPGYDPAPDASEDVTGTDIPGDHEGPDVVDPDDVVLDDAAISAGTLEPHLSVSADTLDLEEPALAPAQISTDTAEAASLADAAAEARAVAAEAEETGTLVAGPMPVGAPVTEAAPEGTAPAGGVAGDSSDTGPARGGSHPAGPVGGAHASPPRGGPAGDPERHPGLYPGTDPAFIGTDGAGHRGGDAGTGDTGSGPGPGDTGSAGGEGSAAGTAVGATAARPAWVPEAPEGHPAAEDGPALRERTRSRSSTAPLLLVIGGAVVLLGLLAWLLLSLFGGSDDEQRVDPSSLAAGECLAGFTDITEDAVLVDCAEPHNAQLVASENYPDDAAFPGRDQLGLRAEAACAAASAAIDPAAVPEDLQVTLLRATPTTETWADGDRRVDCFAVVEDEDTVSRSLLDR